ncbi:MAG: enoyl-CoA hydratase/isomerase family protein [Desulfomonilaceae bacterium]
MAYQTVIAEGLDAHVGCITLNRPDHLNTFSTQMAQELDHALLAFDADPGIRAILIKGAGRGLSAGIDVNEMFGKAPSEYRDWVHLMEKPLITLTELRKPVVVQVHGFAVANGTGLVAAADLAVASDDARFGLTAIKIGLSCLGPVIPVMRLVGRKKALELLLGGELIGAQEALRLGIVNKVVPLKELDEEAWRMVQGLASKSPLAVQISKQAFYTAAEMDYRQAFDFMNEAFARLCSTEDAHEGVKAFLEKRQPTWKGR